MLEQSVQPVFDAIEVLLILGHKLPDIFVDVLLMPVFSLLQFSSFVVSELDQFLERVRLEHLDRAEVLVTGLELSNRKLYDRLATLVIQLNPDRFGHVLTLITFGLYSLQWRPEFGRVVGLYSLQWRPEFGRFVGL